MTIIKILAYLLFHLLVAYLSYRMGWHDGEHEIVTQQTLTLTGLSVEIPFDKAVKVLRAYQEGRLDIRE